MRDTPECGSSIDEEDTEEIEKLYNKKEKTHEDMIKILNISGLKKVGFFRMINKKQKEVV
jgi:hypothetical protein